MGDRRFVLDSSYRRPAGGATVVAGSPLRLFRLGARGVEAIERLENGESPPDGASPLIDRLLDAGAIHPVLDDPDHTDGTQLTVVVPARDTRPLFSPGRCRTIVVDDGSAPPLSGATAGVEMLRLDASRGPGGARNAGLAAVSTPFVAFVDADAIVDECALLRLLAHLQDDRVALVAPRITGAARDGGDTVLDRFERARSPLDVGREAARIAPGTRVAYAPAAVLVCRAEAVRAIGGFDETLRYGEDVDLVWRLVAAGWRGRFEPAVTAQHRSRRSLVGWLAQRVHYGTSAAPLARRHPGAVAPLRMNGWSAATWVAVLARATRTGATIGAASTAALVRKLPGLPAAESVRLAGLGHLYAGRLVLVTLLRAWWPVAVVAALVSRRMRRALTCAAVLLPVLDYRRERPELPAPLYVALRIADDLAYGTGVWIGALQHRTAAPLLPSFSPWPPP